MTQLSQLISGYRKTWLTLPENILAKDREEDVLARFQLFLSQDRDHFRRSGAEGHFTASALFLNRDLSKVLLTLHAKLGKWLQLGGHADGDSDLSRVALTECREESGYSQVEFLDYGQRMFSLEGNIPLPFDWDIHLIPARKDEPEHLHYDVRFLVVTNQPEKDLVISAESKDLRWIGLDEASKLTQEESMQRQFAKLRLVRKALAI